VVEISIGGVFMKKFQKVLLIALIFVLAFTTFAFATEG